MLQRLLASALVALAIMPATAQERPAAETKRGAYVVKYSPAKNLADILAKHFKGAAEIQAGPEGTSNCLLINSPPAVFDEVLKTLEQLDRRPRSVAVEVFVVELPMKKADDKEKRPEEKEFSGAIDDVAKRLDAMMKKGQVAGFKRIQLTTLEGQLGSLALNENKPFAMGDSTTVYRNVGTIIKVTPQVTADASVTLDLNVQDSRGRDSVDQPGKPEFVLTSLAGKISVAPGKATLAKDAKVTSKEGEGETLIVVGARVAEPDAKGERTKTDHELILGRWKVISVEESGKSPTVAEDLRFVITADTLLIKPGKDDAIGMTYKLDPTKQPKAMDTTHEIDAGKPIVQLAIYSLDGDELKLCLEAAGKSRPTKFASKAGDTSVVWLLRRVTKEK
jgi:uncharacterized protein (TIGR03067 family)